MEVYGLPAAPFKALITISHEQAKKLVKKGWLTKFKARSMFDPRSGVTLKETKPGRAIAVPHGVDICNLQLLQKKGYFTVVVGDILPAPTVESVIYSSEDSTVTITFSENVFTSSGITDEELIISVDGVSQRFEDISIVNDDSIVIDISVVPVDTVDIDITIGASSKIFNRYNAVLAPYTSEQISNAVAVFEDIEIATAGDPKLSTLTMNFSEPIFFAELDEEDIRIMVDGSAVEKTIPARAITEATDTIEIDLGVLAAIDVFVEITATGAAKIKDEENAAINTATRSINLRPKFELSLAITGNPGEEIATATLTFDEPVYFVELSEADIAISIDGGAAMSPLVIAERIEANAATTIDITLSSLPVTDVSVELTGTGAVKILGSDGESAEASTKIFNILPLYTGISLNIEGEPAVATAVVTFNQGVYFDALDEDDIILIVDDVQVTPLVIAARQVTEARNTIDIELAEVPSIHVSVEITDAGAAKIMDRLDAPIEADTYTTNVLPSFIGLNVVTSGDPGEEVSTATLTFSEPIYFAELTSTDIEVKIDGGVIDADLVITARAKENSSNTIEFQLDSIPLEDVTAEITAAGAVKILDSDDVGVSAITKTWEVNPA